MLVAVVVMVVVVVILVARYKESSSTAAEQRAHAQGLAQRQLYGASELVVGLFRP